MKGRSKIIIDGEARGRVVEDGLLSSVDLFVGGHGGGGAGFDPEKGVVVGVYNAIATHWRHSNMKFFPCGREKFG